MKTALLLRSYVTRRTRMMSGT